MIGRLVNAFLDTAPMEAIWGDVLSELLDTDLNLINLESALTRSSLAVPMKLEERLIIGQSSH